MAFRLFSKAAARDPEPADDSGGWYADPFGTAARRWFDQRGGWSRDRVEGAGQAPDKTGVARMDADAAAAAGADRELDADGKPVPLSRPVDPGDMADARPVR